MARSDRLLDLMQVLRLYRAPVSGERLADELGVSLRTLYRDIATLQAQGAEIDGTPGRGYVLKPGFMLPPLMFTEEEIEALVLGIRWVAARTDPAFSLAGSSALARIAAVLPSDLRDYLEQTGLFVPVQSPPATVATSNLQAPIMPRLREALRHQLRVRIVYRDGQGAESERTIWPLALAYFEQVQMVSAWCELREDYRNFRVDRIVHMALTAEHFPRSRQELLAECRERFNIPASAILP